MASVLAKWKDLRGLDRPVKANLIDPDDAKQGPPAAIEVYTGGSIRWSDVTIPKGITVIDKRKDRSLPK